MAMAPTASNTTLLSSSRCAMSCSDGQYTENCGGSSTLTLFQNVGLYPAPNVASSAVSSSTAASSTVASSSSVAASSATLSNASPASSSSSSVASTSATSSSTAAAASSTGVKSTVASGYKELGCVQEASGARALTGASYSSTTLMSRQSCTAFCASKGMPLAGIEYGMEW